MSDGGMRDFPEPDRPARRSAWNWGVAFVGFLLLIGLLSWTAIGPTLTANKDQPTDTPGQPNQTARR